MNKDRKELVYDVCTYLCFVVFYFIAHKDMLLEQSLFWALNLLPLPTSNSRFYIPGQFYWFPGNLGSPAQPNIANWLPYIFVLICGGNLVLAEKLLASTTLVSCFTMYFFLSNHFGGSRLARFSAALIYGFGPATALNFADLLHWGYAAIPIVFNYMFNLFGEKRRVKDVLLLGLSLSFMVAFLPQVLSLIFLSFLIFLAVRMLLVPEKLIYLRKITVSFSLAVLVFVATSPYLISGAHQLMVTIGWIPVSDIITSPELPSSPQPSLYFATYSNQKIANTIRLIGGSPGNHLPEGSWMGFALPILAFSSLLLVHRGKKMLDLLALTLVSIVIITMIYGIHIQDSWALWLLYNTPVSLFYYPERPLYIVTFAYSVLISVTTGRLIDIIRRFRIRDRLKAFPLFLERSFKHVFTILLVLSFLTSVFVFAPIFDVQAYQERCKPLPPLYSSVQNWLSSHREDEPYRIMFLPTDSFSVILGYPDVFEVAPGFALHHAKRYADFTCREFVEGKLRNLGSLLAAASVKYVILATPDASTLQDSPVLPPPIHPIWDLQGDPRYCLNTVIQGDPIKIAALLNTQRDLKLIYLSEDFRVYENEMYIPKISVFSNATFIVGSESALSILPCLPGFSVNKVLPIFMHQNPSLAKELSGLSSPIVFFNSDFSDYIGPLFASKYGINLIPFGAAQGWVQYNDNATLSAYIGSYVQTTNNTQSLNASFVVNASSTYDLWLETLFSRQGGELSISVDNEMKVTVTTNNNSVAPRFHWVFLRSINLSEGIHSLTLLSESGSNAVSELVVIPSLDAQKVFEEAVNITTSKKQVYLFNQDSPMFTRSMTTSPGQYYIAVDVPEPVTVDSSMGIINLDSAQKFVIYKENFRPVRNPPACDFDNANYLFHTAAGGQMSITFKGSGGVWAYVAYNSTPSNIGASIPLFFPQPVDNRTFNIDLPPNTIFQPMVNAYNPDLGQNIPDNLSEIIIKQKIGGEYSILNVDGVNITNPQIPDVNGWNVLGSVYLDSGTHNVSIKNGIKESFVAIYNIEDMAQIFEANVSIDYEASKLSETCYNLNINVDSPVFLALSESYHPNWIAYAGDQRLMHFTAFSFSNGFYLSETNTSSVDISVEYQPQLLNHLYVTQQILFFSIGIFLIVQSIFNRIKCSYVHKRNLSNLTNQ